MLEKTLAKLAAVPGGTYLPDDADCFDAAELDTLGPVLQRLLYSPSSLRRVLQDKFGVTLARTDVYGELPTVAEIERSFAAPSRLTLDGIFPDNSVMTAELERLMKVAHEFDPPRTSPAPGVYGWENGTFSFSDPVAYYTMIRTRRPRTILEIGGGWHTRVAQMACARNGVGRIVTVEANPDAAMVAQPEGELIRQPVQALDVGFFNDQLRDGDMLFIDSSHTVKHDGDCLHIYLRILPALEASITVQVHDIFLPETLPLAQMRDQQIFWNEQYLLYAYLLGNPRTRAIFGSRYHARHNPDLLDRFMHGRYQAGGGSFWFEQSEISAGGGG